jgi:hypothetical protein
VLSTAAFTIRSPGEILPKLNVGWASCLLANVVSFRAPGVSPVDARPPRRELEAAWRERVNRARSRYEEKAAICKEMLAERSVWPINREPDPDGRFALSVALQEESAARTEFTRVLRIYTELVLHGTPPDIKKTPTIHLYRGSPCVRTWSKYKSTVKLWSLCGIYDEHSGTDRALQATEDPRKVDCPQCARLMHPE